MKKISCVIPAYNEEKNIKNILDILIVLLWDFIYEIIVINDCSSDKTLSIIEKYNKIIIINNKKNLWKSKSVAIAINKAKWDYIFLLDADLKNLKTQDIKDFIKPILDNKTDVVFSFRKNWWPLFPFKKIDYCTWERIIEKKYLLKEIENMKKLKSYGLEIFINKIIIKNKLRLKVVYLPNVENDFHNEKQTFIKWRLKNFKIWKDILFSAWWIIQIYRINIELEKLLIKN